MSAYAADMSLPSHSAQHQAIGTSRWVAYGAYDNHPPPSLSNPSYSSPLFSRSICRAKNGPSASTPKTRCGYLKKPPKLTLVTKIRGKTKMHSNKQKHVLPVLILSLVPTLPETGPSGGCETPPPPELLGRRVFGPLRTIRWQTVDLKKSLVPFRLIFTSYFQEPAPNASLETIPGFNSLLTKYCYVSCLYFPSSSHYDLQLLPKEISSLHTLQPPWKHVLHIPTLSLSDTLKACCGNPPPNPAASFENTPPPGDSQQPLLKSLPECNLISARR